jgi:alanyl-tRNA synthetase
MTEKLYRDDPYILEFDARLVGLRSHHGKPAVVLDKTAFYPEGGGQPSDLGHLGPVPVVAVLEEGGEVLHVLEESLPGPEVHGVVDGPRRSHFRQQHHGQHLLSRAFEAVAGASTASVHLGEEACSIDLDREVSPAKIHEAFSLANEVVRDAQPVTTRVVSRSEALSLGLSPKEQAGNAVRLVGAGTFDLQPCGGTHPRNTAEVGLILPLGHERHKGGARVRFVCGRKALEVATSRVDLVHSLGELLSASPDLILPAVEKLRDQLLEATRRARELRERALRGEALELLGKAPGSPALVVARMDNWPPEDLRALAAEIVARAPAVALLGSVAGKAHVVFAQSPGLGHDIPALVRDAAHMLGGKGGGRGDLAQGGGDDVAALRGTLDAIAARIQGGK